ncbi:MAG: hypothetical protein ACXW2E_01755 [Nitrososphaeraceae archaeon]
MNEKDLTITITGAAGKGKTTLAMLLGEFLSFTGFSVNINSQDLSHQMEDSRLAHNIRALVDKKTSIVINEMQPKRVGSENIPNTFLDEYFAMKNSFINKR